MTRSRRRAGFIVADGVVRIAPDSRRELPVFRPDANGPVSPQRFAARRHPSFMSRIVTLLLTLLLGSTAAAHPGSGIAVDERRNVFFTDTGKGIWRATREGSLELVSTSALHWLAAAPAGAALP